LPIPLLAPGVSARVTFSEGGAAYRVSVGADSEPPPPNRPAMVEINGINPSPLPKTAPAMLPTVLAVPPPLLDPRAAEFCVTASVLLLMTSTNFWFDADKPAICSAACERAEEKSFDDCGSRLCAADCGFAGVCAFLFA